MIELWKRGEVLWQEDECLLNDPDAERVHQAWQRIFGEPLPEKKLCVPYDAGDAFFYKAPNGATWCYSFDGHAIYAPEGKSKEDYRK